MNVKLETDRVIIEGNGCSHVMTLEQYEKHARASEVVEAAGAMHAKIMAARGEEKKREAATSDGA